MILSRMIKFFLYVLILLIYSEGLLAQGRGGKSGLSFSASIGLPSVTITNPDNSEAGYSGISLQGRLFLPIYENIVNLHGTLKYHDLENKASTSSESEVANHIGGGMGLTFTLKKLYFGYEQILMKARHYYIGNTGIKTEYDYTVGNLFIGFKYNFGALS